MAKYVFGIDLGTTYSCIAYVDETGRATVVNNLEGTPTTPSVVNFASPNQVVVGQVAKENAVIDPDNTVSLVKTLMGKTDFAINYNGEDKTPEEVSSYILRKVVEDASKNLDTEVKDVVITCPAYFGSAERIATRNAGKIAGLNVLEIISEPTAAAIFYGCTKTQEDKTILVFDLGGGTFDVTIMSINSEKIQVICSDGNHQLGGKDWDEAIMNYLFEEFRTQADFDDEFDDYAIQGFRLNAEKAKQQLSARDEVPVMLDASGKRARVILKRDTFEQLTESLLQQAIELTENAISIAKDKGYNVDEILLVGGSSKMPMVSKALIDKFGMEPKIMEPDEAVAKGAAIHAVNVYVNHQISLEPVKFEDGEEAPVVAPLPEDLNPDDYKEDLSVKPEMMAIGGKVKKIVVATTKSFGVEAYDKNDELKVSNIIIKNEPMEDGVISISKTFGTRDDNQENVDVVVYESDIMEENYDVDPDFVLGTALLELPEGLPAGSPIEITLTLNNEGILNVTAKDLTGNKEVHVTMQAKGIMAQEEVDELKEKSRKMVVS